MRILRDRLTGITRRWLGSMCCLLVVALCMPSGTPAYAASGSVTASSNAGQPAAPELWIAGQTVDTRQPINLAEEAAQWAGKGTPVVLQLDSPITPQRRALLAAAGVSLHEYLPNYAYIANLSGADAAKLAGLSFVRWIGDFRPAWKLSPDLGTRGFSTPVRRQLAAAGKSAIYVTLFAGSDVQQVREALIARGDVVIHATQQLGANPVLTVEMPTPAVAELANLASVQWLEDVTEITYRNSSTSWIIQSDVENYRPLWDAGLTGLGQIVGIMDGQINVNHCSFYDDEPIGPTHRKIVAYNTALGSDSHGTHVAGTAVGDAGEPGDTRGMAYEGRLVYDLPPPWPFAEAEEEMVSKLELHASQGANVHTNSWGDDTTTEYNGLTRACDVFTYQHEDQLVLFAITNAGNLRNPENAKNVLAVAASYDTPFEGGHCTGGIGPTADGRRKPEIYAPGCGSRSSVGGLCDTQPMTGTSMASPAIAGLALQMRQYYEQGYYPTGIPVPSDSLSPSGALLKATLLNGTADMSDVSGYPSELEGWGRARAEDSLYIFGDTRKLMVLDDVENAAGRATGAAPVEYDMAVEDSAEALKVTLVWTEPPAAANTALGPATTNNLDLQVVAPDGRVFFGNYFGDSGESTTGGFPDAVNNVEQVLIGAPAVGNWAIRVHTVAVNVGRQGYALVATGAIGAATEDCDDGDPCTEDVFVPGEGCTYANVACDTGACCRAGGACSYGTLEACVGFVCNVTLNELPDCGGLCRTHCYGDANGDDVVTPADRGFISANIGATDPAVVCQFDMDGNGVINVSDRGFVSANIGVCIELPDFMNGSGLNGGVFDTRFSNGDTFQGYGVNCEDTGCP